MSGSSNDDKRPSRVLDHLYIGSRVHAKNRGLLKELGINRILNVTPARTMDPSNGVPNFFEKDRSMTYKRVAVFDNRGEDLLQHFEACISFIEQGSFYGKVLVHCNKGVSRSSTVVAAYLMRTRGLSKAAVMTYLRSRRSIVNPHEGFMAQLEAFETKLVGEREAAIADGQAKKFPDDLLDTGGRARPQGPAIGPIGPSRGPSASAHGPASNSSPSRRRPAVGPSPPRKPGASSATGVTADASRSGPAVPGRDRASVSPPRRASAGTPIGPSRGPPGPQGPPADPSVESASGNGRAAGGAAGPPQSLSAGGVKTASSGDTKGGQERLAEAVRSSGVAKAQAGAECGSASRSPLREGGSGGAADGSASSSAASAATTPVIGPAIGPPRSSDRPLADKQTLEGGIAEKGRGDRPPAAADAEEANVGAIGPAIGPRPGPPTAEPQCAGGEGARAGSSASGAGGTVKAVENGGKRGREDEASAGDHPETAAQKARLAVGGTEERIR